MTKLGVVTCQILELEFAHVISNDPKVSKIWIVEDQYSKQLIENCKKYNSHPVHCVTHIEELKITEAINLQVLVRVMEVGLHSNIPILMRSVKTAVEEMAPFVDAILLGYGLCGNALENSDVLFKDIPVPVMLPMENGEPVDDCVGLIIGGRKNYYAEQCQCAGTMFINAGFSRHWGKIMAVNTPQKLSHKKPDILKRLLANYERSLLLPTSVLGEN